MNTATKVVLIILGLILGWWAIGWAVSLVQALLPIVVLAGIGYVVYLAVNKKPLPWQKRKSLP